MDLYPFQRRAVEDAAAFFASAGPGDKRLYSAPTGTGKSVIQLAVQARVPGCWVVTPRLEIVAGYLEKLGVEAPPTEIGLLAAADARRIATPVRLRNRLLRGELAAPSALIVDEGHHSTADVWQAIDALCGDCPAAAYTATPFRGTPRGTAALREQWGDPVRLVSMPEAAALGHLSVPSCRVVPLVDDDSVEVVAGELSAAGVGAATAPRLREAAAVVADGWRSRPRPTMCALPSRELARQFGGELAAAGVAACVVTGETPRAGRVEAFAACVRSEAVLVQVAVVSEGVDLPVRRLYDLSPVLSPVRWLQQFGRITRPVAAGGEPPEYVCMNRNLLRHAYLLEGLLPPAMMAEAQAAFPPSGRDLRRAVGLEALGRLRAVELPMLGGLTGFMYAVSAVDGATVTQYVVLVHPLRPDPVWARRFNGRGPDGVTAEYGRWRLCDAPASLAGFASIDGSAPSDKQRAWWARAAARHGLDPAARVTRRTFAALPVLKDLGVRL